MLEPIDYFQIGVARLRQQYKESNLKDTYEVFSKESQELEQAYVDVINSRAIDIAVGIQLDIIGEIVGQPRELIDAANIPYFGFFDFPGAKEFGSLTEPGEGGRLKSRLESSTAVRVLTDEEYRVFIRAKIKSNNTTVTPDEIAEIINFIFGTTFTYILENPDGDIAKYRAFINKQLTAGDQLLLSSGIVPKPCGVTVEYVGNSLIDPNNPLIYSSQYTVATELATLYSNGDLIGVFKDSTLNQNDGQQPDLAKQPTFISNAYPIFEDVEEAIPLPFSTDNADRANMNVTLDGYGPSVSTIGPGDDLAMIRSEPTLDFTSGSVGQFEGVYITLNPNDFPQQDGFTHVLGYGEDIVPTGSTIAIQDLLGTFVTFFRLDNAPGSQIFGMAVLNNEPISGEGNNTCGFQFEYNAGTEVFFGVDSEGNALFGYSVNGVVFESLELPAPPELTARMDEVVQIFYAISDVDTYDTSLFNSRINLQEVPAVEFPNSSQLKNFDTQVITYTERYELTDLNAFIGPVGYNAFKANPGSLSQIIAASTIGSDVIDFTGRNYALYMSMDVVGAGDGNQFGILFGNAEVNGPISKVAGVLFTFEETSGNITSIVVGNTFSSDNTIVPVAIPYTAGTQIACTLDENGNINVYIGGTAAQAPSASHTLTSTTIDDLKEVVLVSLSNTSEPTNEFRALNDPTVEYDNSDTYLRSFTLQGAGIIGYKPSARFYAGDEMPLTIPGNPQSIIIFLRSNFGDEAGTAVFYNDGGTDGFTLNMTGNNLEFLGNVNSNVFNLLTNTGNLDDGTSREIAIVLSRNELDPANSWAQLWVNELKVDSVSNFDMTTPIIVAADTPATLGDDIDDLEAVAITTLDVGLADETALDNFVKTNWLAFKQN